MALIVSAINNMTSAKDSAILGTISDFLLSEGVIDKAANSFKVQQKGTPDMSVDVLLGYCYVQNDAWVNGSNQPKFYRVENDATINKAINPNPSANPLIAVVCVKVDVGTLTPGATGNLASTIEVIYGTAAASPVPPAIPNHHYPIAYVQYTSANTTITNALITDRRQEASLVTPNGPEGFLINGQLVVSVASNNLTVALKTLDGNDPSAANPIWTRIGGALRKITSAKSITLSSGTNHMNLAATILRNLPHNICAYLLYRAASDSVELCLSRLFHGRLYSQFSGTNTNERYLAFTGSAPASTDVMHPIGRFRVQMNASNQFVSLADYAILNSPVREGEDLEFNDIINTAFLNYNTYNKQYWRYRIRGDQMDVFVGALSGTNTTPAQSRIRFFAPLTSRTTPSTRRAMGPAQYNDGSWDQGGLDVVSGSADQIGVITRTNINWTAGGGRGFFGQVTTYIGD